MLSGQHLQHLTSDPKWGLEGSWHVCKYLSTSVNNHGILQILKSLCNICGECMS